MQRSNSKNKYNAKKVVINGNTCDSLLEGRHYTTLLQLERAGKITGLKFHPRYPITILGKKICSVVLDFEFFDTFTNQICYVDSKGVYTSESRLRHKILEAVYGIKVEVWRK